MTATDFTAAQAAQQTNRRTDGKYATKVRSEAPPISIAAADDTPGYPRGVRDVFGQKLANAQRESIELENLLRQKEDERVRYELIDAWLRVEAEHPDLAYATSVDIVVDEYAHYDYQVTFGGVVMDGGDEEWIPELEDVRWSSGRNWESFDIVSNDGDEGGEPGRMFLDLVKLREVVRSGA